MNVLKNTYFLCLHFYFKILTNWHQLNQGMLGVAKYLKKKIKKDQMFSYKVWKVKVWVVQKSQSYKCFRRSPAYCITQVWLFILGMRLSTWTMNDRCLMWLSNYGDNWILGVFISERSQMHLRECVSFSFEDFCIIVFPEVILIKEIIAEANPYNLSYYSWLCQGELSLPAEELTWNEMQPNSNP